METINIIRSFPDQEYDLTVQLPIYSSKDMVEISEPLRKEIGGERGLLCTSKFRYIDIEKVRDFFIKKGFQLNFIDERKKWEKFDEIMKNV